MKNFFGWLLVTQRRMVQVTDETSKTHRAIYGISMILMLYAAGVLFSLGIVSHKFFSLEALGGISFKDIIGKGIVFIGVVSVVAMRIIYRKETLEHYINIYKPENEEQDSKEKRLVLCFVIGGFLTMASPIIIISFLS